ncbi:MAG TPA: epoxide hydrolase N-terminal domain-containing protein [Solirubrobacterales bacterium]
MEATTTSKTEIRPSRVEVSDEELTDLRNRIEATRWPDREVDPSQGRPAGDDLAPGRLLGKRLRLAQVDRTFEITFLDARAQAYAFTFD